MVRKPEELVLELEEEPKTDMCFGCYHQSDDGSCKYKQDCQFLEKDLDSESNK